MDLAPELELKLVGEGLAPGLVKSRELAEVMTALEDAVAATALRQEPGIPRDALVVGLSGVAEGSIRLLFRSPSRAIVSSAFTSLAVALNTASYGDLPNAALKPLSAIVAFAARHNCAAELRLPGREAPLATLTADTRIPAPVQVSGSTTIYGRVIRVGGRRPRAMVETAQGETLFCEVSREMARRLGERLYQQAEFRGTATWDADEWSLTGFKIETVEESGTLKPGVAIRQLRELVGRHFREIEDVPAYVASLRGAAGGED